MKRSNQILRVKVTIYKVKYRLSGTKGRLDTADDKMCETEDRMTETIQSEREQRDNLENKKTFERHYLCVTRHHGRSQRMGKEMQSSQI